MKRLLWAALFALPALLLQTTSASAQCWSCGQCATCGPCANTQPFYNAYLSAQCHPIAKAVWPWAGVIGPSCCGTCGYAPGPWYTFWPSAPGGPQSSPYATPGWAFDCHFQTSAPLFFAATAAAPAPTFFAGYNQYGFAPSGYFGQ